MKNLSLGIGILFLAAACSAEVSTQGPAALTASEKAALPDFDAYTEGQQAFFEATGWAGFDSTKLKTTELKDGLAVIFGFGGNILISVGNDGTLMVDNQFPQLHEAILGEIKKLGGSSVDYVINTHWHFDHAEGNRAFGPLGAELIAHENSRYYMSQATDVNLVQIVYPQQPYEKAAIPKISYTDTMNMFFNGQELELYNFGPAHTTGDTFVYFKRSNIIHMGDVANLTGFPFIDADNGGTLDGMIYSIGEILKVIDDDTIVVPGHGEIANKSVIERYLASLTSVRDRVVTLIDQGKSLEEIQAEKPAEEFFGEAGAMLVDRAYRGMQ